MPKYGSNRVRMKEYSVRDGLSAPKVRYFRPSRHMKKSGSFITGFPLDPNTTLAYNFNNGTLIDVIGGIELDFFRSDVGRYFDETGLLRTASVNEPRFDFFADTHEPRGILLEGEGENTLLEANNFLAGIWTLQNVETPVQDEIGPDGFISAWTVTDTVADNIHAMRQSNVFPSVDNRRQNVMVKGGTFRYATFSTRIYGNTPASRVSIFDTQTGVFTAPGGAYRNFTIKELPNGWWLIGQTAFDVNAAYDEFFMGMSPGPEPLDSSYIGAGDTMLFAFPQAELQIDTSWIETGATTALRGKDDCFTEDMSWFSQGGDGTLYAKYSQDIDDNKDTTIVSISSAADNLIDIRVPVDRSSEMRVLAVGENGMIASIAGGAPAGTTNKAAVAWAADNGNAAANGTLAGADDNTLFRPTGMGKLQVGADHLSAFQIYGHMIELGYSTTRKANQFIIDITL